MTFSAIIQRQTLADFSETFGSVVDEVVLSFTDDGLHGAAVDPANVARVEQTLSPSAFDHYETTGIRTGVALEKIDYFLSKSSDDLVSVEYDEETRRLEWECGHAQYSMACIDPDAIRDGGDDPEIELPNRVVLESDALDHAADLVEMVSDHIHIRGRPDNEEKPLRVYGGGDTDDMSMEFGDALGEGSQISKDAETLLSLKYVTNLVGVMPNSAEVELRFGHEYPVLMDYEYAEGNCEVRMTCAPRISTS